MCIIIIIAIIIIIIIIIILVKFRYLNSNLTESAIKRCNLKMFRGLFIGMICSCAPLFKFFSAPPDGATTKYEILNRIFSDFLRTYYCDILDNVYRFESVFSCNG